LYKTWGEHQEPYLTYVNRMYAFYFWTQILYYVTYTNMFHTKKLTNANLAALITTVNQQQNALLETVLMYVTNLKRFQALYIYICTDIICMYINLNWFLIYRIMY